MKKILLFLLICFNLDLSAQNITNGQVYDFQPGDVFQWERVDIYDFPNSRDCLRPMIFTYYTDSIISKSYSALNDTVIYTVRSTSYQPEQCGSYFPFISPSTLPPIYTSNILTKKYTNLDQVVAIDTPYNACIPVNDTFYVSSSYCGKNYLEFYSNRDPNMICFEKTMFSEVFIEGCGGPYVNKYDNFNTEHYTNTLTYYKKGGLSCGTRTSLGINENKINASIHLYPNPSNGSMSLDYSILGANSGELIIYNISGTEVAKYILQAGVENQLQINETELSNGVYFYKMFVNKELKASEKIVIIK